MKPYYYIYNVAMAEALLYAFVVIVLPSFDAVMRDIAPIHHQDTRNEICYRLTSN